jgi:hypothetical protein
VSRPLRVLIACEFSGTVRDAFIRAGHDAMSCDLLPSESDFGPHYQGDVFDVLDDGWDLMVAHPPCTYLTNAANGSLYRTTDSPSGALTGPARWEALIEGALFFRRLLDAPIPRVAIENPVMNGYARSIIGRGPDQVVQPWMFGHEESKAICLWLRGLPPLITTEDVRASMLAKPKAEWARVHWTPPGAERSKIRSLFFRGVADAFAEQWAGVANVDQVSA